MRAIGLDVHRGFCEVAIVDDGELRSAGRIETTPGALELFAGSLGHENRVALEVSGATWQIARLLEPHVGRVIVVSPHDTGTSTSPSLKVRVTPRQRVRQLRRAVAYVRCNEHCNIKITGRLRVGRRSLKLRGASTPAGSGQTDPAAPASHAYRCPDVEASGAPAGEGCPHDPGTRRRRQRLPACDADRHRPLINEARRRADAAQAALRGRAWSSRPRRMREYCACVGCPEGAAGHPAYGPPLPRDREQIRRRVGYMGDNLLSAKERRRDGDWLRPLP